MSKLKNTELVVEKILDANVAARGNDDILYLNVCEHYLNGASEMRLKDFLNARNQTKCPSFVTVTRTRRKIFEKRPELKPKDMTQFRADAVHEYVDYALNN